MKKLLLFAAVLFSMVACEFPNVPTPDPDDNTDTTGTEDTFRPAKSGYFYFKDGTYSLSAGKATAENPIVGIIYQVTNEGKNGKVVSIAAPPANWKGSGNQDQQIDWFTGMPIDIPGVDSNEDGMANMADMWAADSGFVNAPIFSWAHSMNDTATVVYEAGGKGVWYVPAMQELLLLSKRVDYVNPSMQYLRGATPLDPERRYWTSTEVDANNVVSINFLLKTATTISDVKMNNPFYGRAILSF